MIDESQGFFCKRRKNFMAVGIITIIVALLNSTINDITLFGISFPVGGKPRIIGIDLIIWFAYCTDLDYSKNQRQSAGKKTKSLFAELQFF